MFSFAFYSCQKDDDQHLSHSAKGKSHIKILKGSDFSKNSALFKNLSHLETTYKSSLSARSGDGEIDHYQRVYGFNVNREYIKVMETDSSRTYTFGIYRDEETRLLENLVLKEKVINEVDTTYTALLAQYNLTEQDITALNHRTFNNLEYLGANTDIFILVDDGTNPEDYGLIDASCFTISW